MGDIPEDIQKVALSICGGGPYTPVPDFWDHVDDIARAILAERRRCAEVAEKEGKGFKDNGMTQEAYACIVVRKAIINP